MGKSFVEKLREPDEDFLLHLRMLAQVIPIGLGFLLMIVLLITMLLTNFLGRDILVPHGQFRWTGLIAFLIIFMPYLILKIMQGYVALKLKKKP